MTLYNADDFSPPAPVAIVVVRNPSDGSQVADVPMLIDTGADITLVPRSTVESMSLLIDQHKGYELVGFNGSISLEYPVHLEILVLGKSFKGSFLCTNESYGILGRNILNHLRLMFDGPDGIWGEIRQR